MKRLIALIALLLVAFYVVWPGWNAYQIAAAVKANDAATLDRKIDFQSVRATLQPIAEQRIGEIYDRFQAQAGPAASVVVAQIKKDVLPKIAETALANLVTPANLIRVVTEGGSLKQNAEKILQEQVGKIGLPGMSGGAGAQLPGGIKIPGGLGQIAGKLGLPGFGGGGPVKPTDPVATVPSQPQAGVATTEQKSYGLGNIKQFSFLGPLAFEIGVAKDQAATAADVITEMRFIGGDWRVTGIRPTKL